jgi:muconolactone D-isomerase
MLFHVQMDVHLPNDLDSDIRAEIVAKEKDYSQSLQRAGKWPHIWRIVGQYSNFSIFDVESNDELHELLSGLPLFSYMDIRVTPLATHPSDIKAPTERAVLA